MEASGIIAQGNARGARLLLRREDELLFAADPRRCGEAFRDPALRLVRCDGRDAVRLLPAAAHTALFAKKDAAAAPGFARGDVLFAILGEEDALLHHSFLQFAAPALRLLDEAPSVPLIGRCATAPRARGLGLYPRVLRHIMAELGSDGHARVAIYCDRDNDASIRGIRRAGFTQVARLRTLVIGERLALQRRHPGGLRLFAP